MTHGHSGRWARDGPSPRRVRWWRPRTTRARVGVVAVVAVGVAALALAVVQGGGPVKPVWIMTAGNVQAMSLQDASTAAHFFNTSASYGAGASLVKTPVQARYDTTPVLSYASYARFSSDIRSGAIRYPYKWVLYDPENWSATPVGESADQWFVRADIAGKAAAAGDIFQFQDESNTTAGGQYAYMFDTTERQARAANSNVLVFSEVSTDDATAAQMATAARSITPDGFYVAADGKVAQTLRFFQLMKAAGY